MLILLPILVVAEDTAAVGEIAVTKVTSEKGSVVVTGTASTKKEPWQPSKIFACAMNTAGGKIWTLATKSTADPDKPRTTNFTATGFLPDGKYHIWAEFTGAKKDDAQPVGSELTEYTVEKSASEEKPYSASLVFADGFPRRFAGNGGVRAEGTFKLPDGYGVADGTSPPKMRLIPTGGGYIHEYGLEVAGQREYNWSARNFLSNARLDYRCILQIPVEKEGQPDTFHYQGSVWKECKRD